jgi:hypothetical protein
VHALAPPAPLLEELVVAPLLEVLVPVLPLDELVVAPPLPLVLPELTATSLLHPRATTAPSTRTHVRRLPITRWSALHDGPSITDGFRVTA